MICAFLIEELDWSVDMAVNSFTAARAPGITKEDYVKDIYKRYAGVEKDAPKKAAAAEQQLSALGSDVDSVSKTMSDVTLEQKKERKRLKKLKKAAAEEQQLSVQGSDIDPVSKTSVSGETPEQKKERKRLKKLAKQCLEQPVVNREKEEKIKKREKRKKQVDDNGDINCNNNNEKKSVKKLKTVEELVKENSPPEKLVKSEEDLAAKKKKKKDDTKYNVDVKNEAHEEKETGVFKKIFYKPSDNTINLSDAVVNNFRAENKINVTGDYVDHYKPILQFSDFCQDPAIMSVCKVRNIF